MEPKMVVVSRFVGSDEPHNFYKRDVHPGQVFWTCTLPTYNCIDEWHGIALTEVPNEYPFFEFPKDAVEFFNQSDGENE